MYKNFESTINEKGITSYRVAKDLGIAYSTLCDWKHGRSKPKIDKLHKIATYLGIPVNDLIEIS